MNEIKQNKIVEVENVSIKFNMASERIESMKEYVIKRIKGAIKYDEFFALTDVSFSMNRGESVALVGLNGCGKSTLLKTIAGVLKPYKGRVVVNGSTAPLIELGAGFDMDLTAEENVYLNGALLGHSHEEMESYLNDIIDFSELGNFMGVPVKNFSSGMLARLGFSIATIGKPDLLIVDETLAVGDFTFQKKCEERIGKMLENGTSLLFVSHDVEQVKKLCQRVIWIEKGRIIRDGNKEEVIKAYVNAY